MGVFFIIVSLLSGCNLNQMSKESTFEHAQLAMQEVENVEVKFKENLANSFVSGRYLIDVARDEKWIELVEANTNFYMRADSVLAQSGDREIERLDGTVLAIEFAEMAEFLLDPYQVYATFDENFAEQFTLTEKAEEIRLTYDSDSGGTSQLAKEILFHYMLEDAYLNDEDKYTRDIKVRDYSIEMVLNHESYALDMLKIKIIFEDSVDAPGEKFKVQNIYTYKHYDEVGDIPVLKWNGKNEAGPIEAEEATRNTPSTVTIEDVAVNIEAVIEASVYQDVQAFIAKDPSGLADDEKARDGEAS